LIDGAGVYTVALVASDREDARALQRARDAAIPALHIPDPRDGAAINSRLLQYRPDLVVLAGYLKLVPAEVVSQFSGRMINIHPALLPAFGGKGMYGIRVHQAVLESGACVSGPTVHLVDEEYDRGKVLAQWPVPVRPGDTAEALQRRVLAVEHLILPEVVRQAALNGGPVPLRPADDAFATARAPRLDFSTGP
jgi:phosphoribosylglycinamide formyltransferase/phosphoribosylglycinamide formyltransferase-1